MTGFYFDPKNIPGSSFWKPDPSRKAVELNSGAESFGIPPFFSVHKFRDVACVNILVDKHALIRYALPVLFPAFISIMNFAMAHVSSPARLISNAAVFAFYTRMQTHRLRSSAANAALNRKKDKPASVEPSTLESCDTHSSTMEGISTSSIGTGVNRVESHTVTPARQHSLESMASNNQNQPNNTSKPIGSTSSTKTNAIPRKEFQAIKKRLRKRELRRRRALETREILLRQAAQKPK
ncbi:hypothetical protein FBU30_010914 [Linnemannia zychae]|nr:hypothetical protein FBU30_010914 [Linnemannia zychae]